MVLSKAAASIWICAGKSSKIVFIMPIASENMIADIGTAARSAPALELGSTGIYGDIASHQSVTLLLQPNALDTRTPRKKIIDLSTS